MDLKLLSQVPFASISRRVMDLLGGDMVKSSCSSLNRDPLAANSAAPGADSTEPFRGGIPWPDELVKECSFWRLWSWFPPGGLITELQRAMRIRCCSCFANARPANWEPWSREEGKWLFKAGGKWHKWISNAQSEWKWDYERTMPWPDSPRPIDSFTHSVGVVSASWSCFGRFGIGPLELTIV